MLCFKYIQCKALALFLKGTNTSWTEGQNITLQKQNMSVYYTDDVKHTCAIKKKTFQVMQNTKKKQFCT